MDNESDDRRQLDRDGFVAPRSPYMSKDEHEEAERALSQDLLERGWRRLIHAVEVDEAYPSPQWIADLVAESVPEFASDWIREYLRGRLSGDIARQGRPDQRPDNLHVPDDELYFSTGGVPPAIAFPVYWVRRRYARYKAIETTRRPRDANLHRFRYVESQGVWKVKSPKQEAVKIEAERLDVAVRTLERWCENVDDRYGPEPDE